MATSSSKQNSRFSTLKVFKFAGAAKPPPPPPKDPYYLANPSLASLNQSLSPEAFSPPFATRPTTPLSTGYAASARSPSPTPSYTPSYTPSFAASRTTLAPDLVSPEPSGSRKGFLKFASLGKRPKTPKSTPSTSSTPPPEPLTDDPSISLPWNFQHNVHVDEAFVGLPPTWSASLAGMGFSEEEIANINARRAASRPTLYPLLRSDRPDSPASSAFSSQSRPNPRSSSLMRQDFDNMSQRSETSYSADVSRNLNLTTDSYDDSTLEDSSTIHLTPTRTLRSPETTYTSPSQFPIPPPGPGPSQLINCAKESRPRTPTKRGYHVANESISTMASPPPAYGSPKETILDDVDEDLTLPPATVNGALQHINGRLSDVEGHTDEGSREVARGGPMAAKNSPQLPTAVRLSTQPPRLSLHQETLGDLSNWTESLFSMIPSSPKTSVIASVRRTTPSPPVPVKTPASPSTPPAKPRAPSASPRPSSSNTSPSPSTRQRPIPPQKPLPLHLQSSRVSPPSSPGLPPIPPSSASSNPLWHEVYSLVRSPDSAPASPSPSAVFTPSLSISGASSATSEESRPKSHELRVDFARDKENRDSSTSTMTVTPATIVRHVSVAKRARANVVQPAPRPSQQQAAPSSTVPSSDVDEAEDKGNSAWARSNSPVSSESNSSDASSVGISLISGSGSASSPGSRPTTFTTTDASNWKTSSMLVSKSSSIPYVETSPQPSPMAAEFDHNAITPATVRSYRQCEEGAGMMGRPSILIDNMPLNDDDKPASPWSFASTSPSPSGPVLRYAGWVTEVIAPIQAFINDTVDPRDMFTDLQEIAEGESGSVYAARAVNTTSSARYVAIKQVTLVPAGSPKLVDLDTELRVLKDARHPNLLTMDALYIDFEEDTLWISMELMDRSLADVLNLMDEGVLVTEAHISQFAKDVTLALGYLHSLGIAHRDVRSDNLLINQSGVVKLADFSNSVKVADEDPLCNQPAGVIYWQAPEMRRGPYNPLKVDVWSLGATMWEMAQGQPPFADASDANEVGDELPPLDQPELFSRSFHDFLQLCSRPCSSRPDPDDLLKTPFVFNANNRSIVAQLLMQCRSAEENLSRRQSTDSQGTVSPS